MAVAQGVVKKYTESGDDTQKIYPKIIESRFSNCYWHLMACQKDCPA